MTQDCAPCSVFRKLPSSNPFSEFGTSMREAAQIMSKMMSQLREVVDEKTQREERLRMAPDVLRGVVAPHVNEEVRVLIWGLANDLEEHLSDWDNIEDDQASLADDMKKHMKRSKRP